LADGYYEWRKTGARKQPYYLRMKDDRPFAFAGLWERWEAAEHHDGEPLETCTIITTAANELSRPIHDRMPAILQEADYDLWLDPAEQGRRLEPLLAPHDSAPMIAYPVSTLVNNPRNDLPTCIEAQGELF
jgi:putative SOS response-associated peptidase YedK